MPWPTDPPAHPSPSQSTASGEGALLGWAHGARSRGPGRCGNPRTGADAPQIGCSRRGLEMAVRDAGSTLPATLRLRRGQIRRPQMRLVTGTPDRNNSHTLGSSQEGA
ncbi:hypothetical protein DE146DRAFT_755802 [Phaeosphaeria sp. MPI-PUGE-AT-0046c]|nr:hypothetical protein DE146DRAFT_755802 [Phaeosphaeria sp. MPI-PUGE-AT-0046c]